MAAAMKVDFPNLVSDTDRHGNVRYYYRVKGARKVRIKAAPGTAEFQAAYDLCKKGNQPNDMRIRAGSLGWLISTYLASPQFLVELSDTTQITTQRTLANLASVAGDKPFAALKTERIHAWMDARADRPESANNLLKALRSVFKFAMKRKIATFNPTIGIMKIRTYSDGFHTWTIDEVKTFFERHPKGTPARMAITIALFTGLRKANIALLGRQHISSIDGLPHIIIKAAKSRRKKVKDIALPVLPLLYDEISAAPKTQLTFIQTEYGQPFSVSGLGNKFKTWCKQANLPHCSLHGLRKAGATIAANNGASDRQLMAMYGWESPEQANIYTAKRNNARLADDGMKFLKIEGLK